MNDYKSYHGPIGTARGSYYGPVGTARGSYYGPVGTARGSNVTAAQREDQPYSYFTSFLNMNPKIGYLVFEVHEDSPVRGRVPVSDARIMVSRPLGGGFYFSKIVETDESGWTEPIPLPTVSRDLSLTPGERQVFTSYHASVEAPGYERQDLFEIQIFDGVTSVQHVALQPNGMG